MRARRHLLARAHQQDVPDTAAKLKVAGSIEALHLKELFPLLSSTGLPSRGFANCPSGNG
jgi:hypothetical protein